MSAVNVRPSGPRMSKKARERKYEAEKAEKALGGGILKDSTGASQAKPHWYVELQWFRLLRGQARLNQIARILVELSPDKVFDPRDIYSKHLKEEEENKKKQQLEETKQSGKKGKGKKQKEKKLSKKEMIIAANKAKKQKEAIKRDEEKLRALGTKAASRVKLKTENGRLLLLMQLLKNAIKQKDTVEVLDTMWEIEDVIDEIGEEECKPLAKQYSDEIATAKSLRKDKKALNKKNLIDFQLTEMSDRLPPLNLHSLFGKFKLDDWQLRVIRLIEERKSVLISAPTSSGKTVLSTYVCTSGGRVLFVVPTEPLAWQVGAMLRALKLDIALVVPTLNFVPPKFEVVVGTPHSLESTLTKQIGVDFDYAIFDEVHSLNNDCGPAMQRLIRTMPPSCRFMALSATVGNVNELKSWWEESIVGQDGIELVVHSSRFINLQRHVWSNPTEASATDIGEHGTDGSTKGDGTLQFLHPCTSLSVKQLVDEGFSNIDLAFTPVDTYRVYQEIKKEFKNDENPPFKIKSLKPEKFFNLEDTTRITLMQAKAYEDFIKKHLEILSKECPERTQALLARLAPSLESTVVDASDVKVDTSDSQQPTAVDQFLNDSSNSGSVSSLTNLLFDLKKREMTPVIAFQLDSVWCQCLFDGLLREMEKREDETHPDYRDKLEKAQSKMDKVKNKVSKKGKKDDDDEMDAQEFGASSGSVDVNAPHPDFVFTPPGRGMGATEALDVQSHLRDDLPMVGDIAHPLIRGLRRGIGLYVTGLPSAYHRVVQAFAQRGRLGVVLSDELLAYGVNMPFRTTVFFGDSGRSWLTPLMHQQMAGRAGRRGLDRKGHLVYAGFKPERLKELLRGEIPAVTGLFPLYPTIPLQLTMNERWEVSGTALNREKMEKICATPLAEYLEGKKVENYFNVAEQWIKELGVLDHEESSYKALIPELVWELREFVPESLAVEYILEPMVKHFKGYDVVRGDSDSKQQMQMFLLFCRICAREPFMSDSDKQSSGVDWVDALPAPNNVDEFWDEWTSIIDESQQRILNVENLEYKDQLMLPVAIGEPLDNQCYASFVRNQIDPKLPTSAQHFLRQRLWSVGEVLRITSNVLGRCADLQPVQNLIRKAFVRVRYILDETFQRNWKLLDEQHMFENEK